MVGMSSGWERAHGGVSRMKRILISVRVVGSGGGRVDGNGRGRMRRREVGGPRWWRGCVRRGDRMGAGRGWK